MHILHILGKAMDERWKSTRERKISRGGSGLASADERNKDYIFLRAAGVALCKAIDFGQSDAHVISSFWQW